MANSPQGPRLSDDPRTHAKEEHLDSYFGPALRTTDRPDYFSIRSKLIPALAAIAMVLSLFAAICTAQRPAGTVFLIVFAVLLFVLLRIYMGVVFDFFPDGVHSFLPELIIYHSLYFLFDFLEKKRERLGVPGLPLRNIDRTRLSAVQMHRAFGRSFVLICLDDLRVGRIWWLSSLVHPRRILTLMLSDKDADKAISMIQAYIYFKPNR